MLNRFVISLLCTSLLSGCAGIRYYAQSMHGHLSLMGQSQPIQQLLDEPDTDQALKQRLVLVADMRAFSIDQLHLPDNDSYRSYVELNRQAVVWSVVATEALSVEPKHWCYPIIGCAAYRGYFNKQRAVDFAEGLRQENLDVAVLPVPAYSTLGWFDDPLPSTVIDWSEADIAGLIFHELAHQKLYVKGDSAFNEAFANSVERIGVQRWLMKNNRNVDFERWQRSQQREQAFVKLLLQTRNRLASVYSSVEPEQQKLAQKRQQFQWLQQEYQQLRNSWEGYTGYDRWFARQLNNAHLASVATYELWTPAFDELLRQVEGSLPDYYRECERLASLSAREREREMQRLLILSGKRSPTSQAYK